MNSASNINEHSIPSAKTTPTKKAYRAPELKEHGSISELTELTATLVNGPDGGTIGQYS